MGSCGFSSPDNHQSCECFYSLLPKYWGKGFATEAMHKLINYGFSELNIAKIIAHINRDNFRSAKVAKKIGMCCEKLTQFKGIPGQGMLFSITKQEYDRQKKL